MKRERKTERKREGKREEKKGEKREGKVREGRNGKREGKGLCRQAPQWFAVKRFTAFNGAPMR